MERIIIAGGAGFLGSHLADRLLEQGNKVIVIDDLSTGNFENIAHLDGDRRFTFIEWDVTKPLKLGADKIYNLASPASPPRYQLDPVQTITTNFLGSLNLLEVARSSNAKILQASTSEVYGDPEQHPQTETYWGNVNPVGIRSCYDEGKRAAETLFFDYWRMYGVPIKVMRIFNTYGPRMDKADGRVVSNFITQALSGKDITVYGDGTQTRSFCYVDDLIDGMIKLMESPSDVLGPVNVGNPNEFTMLELASKVIALTGSSSSIKYLPLPGDDPRQRKPDISLARSLLDWEPTVELDAGLQSTIRYFQSI